MPQIFYGRQFTPGTFVPMTSDRTIVRPRQVGTFATLIRKDFRARFDDEIFHFAQRPESRRINFVPNAVYNFGTRRVD